MPRVIPIPYINNSSLKTNIIWITTNKNSNIDNNNNDNNRSNHNNNNNNNNNNKSNKSNNNNNNNNNNIPTAVPNIKPSIILLLICDTTTPVKNPAVKVLPNILSRSCGIFIYIV